jgi:ribosome-binding protein aMBF1 (putative translation factor)
LTRIAQKRNITFSKRKKGEVAMEFKDFVAIALKKNPKLKNELAKQFEVAPSTVERWASGTARPHPLLQRFIRKFISRVTWPG